MLINSPSNPTGQAFTEDTLETILTFCEDKKITLISDEIYADIFFAHGERTSAFPGTRLNSGLNILTGGLSKVRPNHGWFSRILHVC